MAQARRPLFRLRGIPITVDTSWLFVAALVTWSLATGVFVEALPQAPASMRWVMGFAGALGLFASVLLHELAHSVVAQRYGVGIRGIRLWLFGGVAEMESEPPSARAELWIALAGPGLSVVLGVALSGIEAAGTTLGGSPALLTVIGYLGLLNLVLAGFNLLPAFPLDGGRVARAALWAWRGDLVWATRVTGRVGSLFGSGFIALGVLTGIVQGDLISGLWIGVLGLFLRGAAQQQVESVVAQHVLSGISVGDVMTRPAVSLPKDITVADAIEDYVYRVHHKLYPVVDDGGQLLGSVHLRELAEVEAAARPHITIAQVLMALEDEEMVSSNDDATEALQKMGKNGTGRLIVVDEGRPVGMLALKDLLEVLKLRAQLDPKLRGHR